MDSLVSVGKTPPGQLLTYTLKAINIKKKTFMKLRKGLKPAKTTKDGTQMAHFMLLRSHLSKYT